MENPGASGIRAAHNSLNEVSHLLKEDKWRDRSISWSLIKKLRAGLYLRR